MTWDVELPGVESEVSAELWTLPGGQQMLGSTKVSQSEADATATALDAGAATASTRRPLETKTRAALEASRRSDERIHEVTAARIREGRERRGCRRFQGMTRLVLAMVSPTASGW